MRAGAQGERQRAVRRGEQEGIGVCRLDGGSPVRCSAERAPGRRGARRSALQSQLSTFGVMHHVTSSLPNLSLPSVLPPCHAACVRALCPVTMGEIRSYPLAGSKFSGTPPRRNAPKISRRVWQLFSAPLLHPSITRLHPNSPQPLIVWPRLPPRRPERDPGVSHSLSFQRCVERGRTAIGRLLLLLLLLPLDLCERGLRSIASSPSGLKW